MVIQQQSWSIWHMIAGIRYDVNIRPSNVSKLVFRWLEYSLSRRVCYANQYGFVKVLLISFYLDFTNLRLRFVLFLTTLVWFQFISNENFNQWLKEVLWLNTYVDSLLILCSAQITITLGYFRTTLWLGWFLVAWLSSFLIIYHFAESFTLVTALMGDWMLILRLKNC